MVFFAAFPLRVGRVDLGYMVLDLYPGSMIGAGFQKNIRSEFNLKLDDGVTTLFRFPETPGEHSYQPENSATRVFPVANRVWRLSITPKSGQLAATGYMANISIPLLGFFLAAGMGLLIHLLSQRMALYRAARDQALQEVAQRQKAQSALYESEARYHGVFDSATDGLLVLNDRFRILEANPTACAMYGYEAGCLAGMSLRDLFDAEHLQVFQDFVRQVREFGSARLESVNRRQDGTKADLDLRGTTLEDAGEPRVLATLSDVSDLKQAVRRHTLLSHKIMMAQEEERGRISRDLHDELGQVLTALHLELDWLQSKSATAPSEVRTAFQNAVGMVESAATELRRICKGLRPPLLDDLGLEPAIRQLIEEERIGLRTDVSIQLNEGGQPVQPEIALCVYRVLQEALHNIRRHSAARTVSISLVGSDSELFLSVYDDGVGFDMSNEERAMAGFGIAGMRERAYLVKGAVDLRSEPHQGTRVSLRVPLGKLKMEDANDQNPDSG